MSTFEELRASARQPFESYEALHTRLEQSGQFEEAERQVEGLYAQRLSSAEFLTKKDWEMLTTLWLYDPETADHSVETYRIAHERIERPIELKEHAVVINLSQEFSREGVSKEQFLRACLLHDIGKLSIPIEVLTNHLTDAECARILYANYESLESVVREVLSCAPPQALPGSSEELLRELRAVHVRPQALVPVRQMLAPGAEVSVATGLTHLNLTLNDSLLTIMRTHDRYSRTILTEEELPVEAALAGAHHRHEKEYSPTSHTITIGTLQVSVDLADIIHLSDVTQAMDSRRHYKESQSELIVLATLVEHASHGLVDPFLTYLWVADEMKNKSFPVESGEQASYRTIETFLEEGRKTYESQLSPYRHS